MGVNRAIDIARLSNLSEACEENVKMQLSLVKCSRITELSNCNEKGSLLIMPP